MAKASEMPEDDTFEGGDGSVMIDLNQVEDAGDFEVLPRGTYKCVIEDCEYSLSQNSGQPMWSLKLNVSEGDYEGRKLFTHMSFSPKALPLTKKALAAVAPEFLAAPFDPATEAHRMVSKMVMAKIKIEPYEGKNRNRVQELSSASAGDSFLDS